ncbi:MlaD family protein [Patulibacter minatonensis]|uniref:MlaD family protein n=1 Tax=Patulibacter minatonensis TaxID=298163 RepID=UPI0004AE04A9|nr:MlaD family protein [Patulibacter minatonensis]
MTRRSLGRPTRRRRRRRERISPQRAMLQAGLVLGLIALVIAFAVTAYNGVPGKTYRTAYAIVPATGNLIKHDQVRIAGVRVGQVTASTIDPDGRARLKLQLSGDTKLPEGTSVLVRANGLLGARFVQLNPGRSSRMLPDGAEIKGSANALTYGVPEAIDTFDKQTRGAMGTSVRELGAGMVGNGKRLNETIERASDISQPFQTLVATVLAPPGAAERLVPALNRLMIPFNASREGYTAMVPPADKTLQPFVDQRAAVHATLDGTAPTLDAVKQASSTGQRLLASVDRLSGAANRTLPRAPGALRATTAFFEEAPTPLNKTSDLLERVPSAVPATTKITDSVRTLLDPLDEGLKTLVPISNTLGDYGCDIENFGVTLRSMTGYGGDSIAVGKGELGEPAGAFRVHVVVPSPTELLQIKNNEPVGRRDGYPAPCKYVSTEYPTFLPQDGTP